MGEVNRRVWFVGGGGPVLFVAIAIGWWLYHRSPLPEGFAAGNGRLEAEEIHIATKLPGRVAEVLVDEGDEVEVAQVLARMDTNVLQAELHRASALLRGVEQRRNAAAAVTAERRSQCRLAGKELKRAISLFEQHVGSEQQVDIQSSRFETAEAACDAAHAALVDAEAAIDAGAAQVERIEADIADGILLAPRSGRIQYRLAEPGEVLPAGGKALTVVDLDDVYMTLFLSEQEAGRSRIGAEARIVLDALPERPIRARVSFVASKAQFTPKQVETTSERQKLSFRVKAQVVEGRDPLLKPGMPGVAYIRLDETSPWPERLR